jgi:hypothetical protein
LRRLGQKIDKILSEEFAERGLVNKKDLEPLLKEADTANKSLLEILVSKGLSSEKDILKILKI